MWLSLPMSLPDVWATISYQLPAISVPIFEISYHLMGLEANEFDTEIT